MKLPGARTNDIIVQEARGELLIYDLTTHKAFRLNETAKIVFNACDGKSSFDDLKRQHKFTDDLIRLTLDTLRREKLIDAEANTYLSGMSRRETIRQVGRATLIALPVISSIAAPKATQAQSRTTCGQFCTDSNLICSAPCPNCLGQGSCSSGGGPSEPCSNIGGSCTLIGECVDTGGGVRRCTISGQSCSGLGPCTETSICEGGGYCQS